MDFAATEQSRNAITGQFLVKECRTASSVVNALAKAGIDLGENGSIFPRPKGKPR